MSTERDEKEFERYLEFHRARRRPRAETLGGIATVLFLSTIDLGVSGADDPAGETHVSARHDSEIAPVIELASRAARRQHLAGFATEAAATELGYSQAV